MRPHPTQAHMGVMDVTGFPGSPPVKAGVAFMDFMTGVHLYAAIVTALVCRGPKTTVNSMFLRFGYDHFRTFQNLPTRQVEAGRTGRGRVVEVAMAEAAFPTMASNQEGYYETGAATRTGNLHNSGEISHGRCCHFAAGHSLSSGGIHIKSSDVQENNSIAHGYDAFGLIGTALEKD